jgi:Uma2 family endonuclease
MSESAAQEPYYTFEEWCNLPESVRAELYDGKISMMAFPTPAHQSISRELTLQIGGFLKGKPCTFFAAPIGVKLFDD